MGSKCNVLYDVKQNEGIVCCFKNDIGETATCFIPKAKVLKLLEDTAYELIQKPKCQSSSCAVNNFCECEPINEDMWLVNFTLQ